MNPVQLEDCSVYKVSLGPTVDPKKEEKKKKYLIFIKATSQAQKMAKKAQVAQIKLMK